MYNLFDCPLMRAHTANSLRHCLVWQEHRPQSYGATEGCADSPLHHWGKAPCQPGHLYQAVWKEGPEYR